MKAIAGFQLEYYLSPDYRLDWATLHLGLHGRKKGHTLPTNLPRVLAPPPLSSDAQVRKLFKS